MYEKIFDISKVIAVLDIMIFCNIAPLSTRCGPVAPLLLPKFPSSSTSTPTLGDSIFNFHSIQFIYID